MLPTWQESAILMSRCCLNKYAYCYPQQMLLIYLQVNCDEPCLVAISYTFGYVITYQRTLPYIVTKWFI